MSISAISSSAALASPIMPRPSEIGVLTGSMASAADPAALAQALTGTAAAAGTPLSESRLTASPGIQQALDEVRDALAPVAQNLQFSLDEDSGRTVIKIVDSSTDEVIKQIPSEEILAIAKALDKLQGVLIRQQA